MFRMIIYKHIVRKGGNKIVETIDDTRHEYISIIENVTTKAKKHGMIILIELCRMMEHAEENMVSSICDDWI